MASSDAAFLAEVEDFLVSCNLPTIAIPILKGVDDSDVLPPDHPKHQGSVDDTASSATINKRRRSRGAIDDGTKLELMRAKDRQRRKRYRERLRIEKETLKQQVVTYSKRVDKLLKTKKSVVSTRWEVVAKRQLEARLQAEEEQRGLVKTIESRIEMVQEFTKFVHDQFTTVTANQIDLMNQQEMIRTQPCDGDFFEAYIRELDTVYAETDEVFSTQSLDVNDVTGLDPGRWEEDRSKGYFTYSNKLLIPSNFEQVGVYMWCASQLHHRQEGRRQYDSIVDPDNTVAFKFRITKRLPSGRTASVVQRAVARRYMEDDRMVYVWRSLTEGETVFSGMYADECGWCVSIPSSNAQEPHTLVKTVMRHMPIRVDATSTNGDTAQQFTGMLLESGTDDANEIADKLDKLLLCGD